MRKVLILLTILLSLSACPSSRESSGAKSETIAPAAPQPGPTDSEAMTQTVNVEDGRSEEEGGALTATTSTTTSTTTTVLPPKKKVGGGR